MKTIYSFLFLLISFCATAQVQLIKECDIVYNGGQFYMLTNGTTLFFGVPDSLNTLQPWISDGTPAGTKKLKDGSGFTPHLHSPYGGTLPGTFITVYKNEFYYVASDGIHGDQVWKTDGTPAGTKMLKLINPTGSITGLSFNNLPYFTELNGILYFAADDGTHGTELWSTDGTPGNTVMVKDIYPGANQSTPEHFTLLNDKIIFAAWGENKGVEVWSTDGTPGGTQMIKDIRQGPYSCFYSNSSWLNPYFKKSGGYVYFYANVDSPIANFHLWRTDGTLAGTIPIGTTITPQSGSELDNADLNGSFLFLGSDGNTNHSDLFKSDGTPSGTVNITTSPIVNVTGGFFPFKNKLYFNGNSDVTFGLGVTDGTVGGTSMVKGFEGLSSFPAVSWLATDGNYLYGGVLEKINSSAMEWRLLQSNGTSAGTIDIPHYGFVGGLTNFNGKMYYAGYDTIISSSYVKPGLYAFTPLNVGVDEVSTPVTDVQFFPNPFANSAALLLTGNEADLKGASLSLTNVVGQQVATYRLTGSRTVINRGELPAGLYFYRVVTSLNNKVINTGKIIVAD